MSRALALSGALLGGLVLASLAAGCGGRRYRATYSASVGTPRMAAIDDGLWVVTDYDDPVFYSGDHYWRYHDGYWYRSGYLGGWNRVGVTVVPPRIRRIDRPRRYRRWTPRRRVRVRPVPQRHYRPHVRRETRVRRPPAERRRVVRPNRYDRRDARRGRRLERREDRRERRHERRERRRDRREARHDLRQDRREARRERRRRP